MLKTIQWFNRNLKSFTFPECLVHLKTKFGISSRAYDGGRHFILDYSQIDSPRSSEIVQECRSLIIHYDESQVTLASSKFPRFFNYGEMLPFYEDFKINSQMSLASKEDGSIIGLWFNRETQLWDISTRGMAKAEGPHPLGGTFRDSALRAFGLTEEQFQERALNLNKDNTYVFELVGPMNRCVRPYQKDEMVLIGVFSTIHGCITPNSWWTQFFAALLNKDGLTCRAPNFYPVPETFEEIQAMADSLPGLEEGFVLYDPVTDKRMKFKSRTYIVAHDIRGQNTQPTPKRVYSLVLTGEQHEFLAYFPEYKHLFDAAEKRVHQFLDEMIETYLKAAHIEDQKEFAAAVAKSPAKQYMFLARKNDVSIYNIIATVKLEQKLKHFI
jgi:hypothetical protein